MNTAVIRALDILRLVGNHKEAMSLTDIANAVDIPKTTAFNIINTLVQEKCLVIKDPRSKLYSLGIGIFELGSLYTQKSDYLNIVRDSLREIRDKTGASAFFAAEDNKELIYLDKVENFDSIRSSIHLGVRMPMHCASHGKAILSRYSPEALDEYLFAIELKPRTKNSITDAQQLRADLELAREQGYAISDEENDIGLYCLAAPILDESGQPISAVSASFVKVNMTEEKLDIAKKVVVDEAKMVSRLLGYRI